MIDVFKLVHGYYDLECVPYLPLSLYCNTRCHNRIFFMLNFIWFCAKTLTVRVVSKWNSLPADVVNAPSVDAFKNRLDKIWSNQEVRFNYKAQFDY